MSRYYDYDYYDFYPRHYYSAPDYTSIKNVTEWMKEYMCFGLGINRVCEFLKKTAEKDDDPVADMYRTAILAERESAGAKYGGGSYSQKETHIKHLLKLCFDWRDKHATKQQLPDLEKRIEQIKKSNMKEKKKNSRINQLRNTLTYQYDNQENTLKFAKEYSGIHVAPHIYYFELPGCEQISYHSNLNESSGGDKISWDGKEDSTLLKLNYAVSKKYGQTLKKNYSIEDNIYNSFNHLLDDIKEKSHNAYTSYAYNALNSFILEKSFTEKDKIIKELRMTDMFANNLISEITAGLPKTKEAEIYSKLLVYIRLAGTLSKTSFVYPKCWISELTNMSESIKDSIDDYVKEQNTGIRYEMEKDTVVVKISNNSLKLIYIQDAQENIRTESYTSSFAKIEKLVFDKYAEEYFPEIFKKHIEAEAYKERLRLAREQAEREKKENERKKRLNEVLSYEYFTKSMLKECLMWTDTLIQKFAGKPDQTKPNPMYKCADPMTLYKKERIFEIEKQPAFIAELKKSYKRRKLDWPYENDVITHN